MAEKATLLQPLPPVAKESTENKPKAETPKVEAGSATEVQAESEVSITPFQATTYGSFVLSFVLAGFAAVILYRKAISHTGTQFIKSSKLLACALALTGLHGFVATYAYTNYLRQTTDTAPLSLTLLNWILFGAAIGYISNRLIARDARLKTSDAVIDAILYVTVFIMVTLATSDQIGPNAALLLALTALITCTAPLSRFFISCKRLKFNQQSADQRPQKALLYSLVLLPAVLPLIALIYVVEGIGLEVALFVVNIITIILIIFSSINMLAALRRTMGEPAVQEEALDAVAAEQNTAPAIDPLVQELLAEQAAMDQELQMEEEPAEAEPDVQPVEEFTPPPPTPNKPRVAPPIPASKAKSSNPKQPAAPRKPESTKKDSEKPAPNSPTKVVAPAKPKKRF